MTDFAAGTEAAAGPAPVASLARSPISQPFWTALSEGRVEIPFCGSCGSPHFYPRKWCPKCWSDDISWREVESVGTVWAMSTVHLAFQGISESDIPYTVAFVDLDAGVRMPGRISDAGAPVAIGSRVRLVFAEDPARDLPLFAAAG